VTKLDCLNLCCVLNSLAIALLGLAVIFSRRRPR